MRNVRFAETFVKGVVSIYSERLLELLDRRLAAIEAFPELGSSDVRRSLIDRFGTGIRKLPAPPFVIVYRYDKQNDTLDFLALPYEKKVR